MKILQEKTTCPNCEHTIGFPVIPPIRMKELEAEYDMLEISAQEKYDDLWLWLQGVSLFGLIKFWIDRGKK